MSGLEGFTRQAAVELTPYGIHVHAVEIGDEIVSKVMALLISKLSAEEFTSKDLWTLVKPTVRQWKKRRLF